MLIGAMIATLKSPYWFEISTDFYRLWWVLPFASAVASLGVMIGAFLMCQIEGRRIAPEFLSRLYLIVCPSLAILGIMSTLPLAWAPPAWVGFTAPALLFTSAWAHYHSLDYSDDVQEAVR